MLAARRRRSLQQVADMAYWLGSPDVVPVHADVSKVEDCQRLIEEAISNFGRCKFRKLINLLTANDHLILDVKLKNCVNYV